MIKKEYIKSLKYLHENCGGEWLYHNIKHNHLGLLILKLNICDNCSRIYFYEYGFEFEFLHPCPFAKISFLYSDIKKINSFLSVDVYSRSAASRDIYYLPLEIIIDQSSFCRIELPLSIYALILRCFSSALEEKQIRLSVN